MKVAAVLEKPEPDVLSSSTVIAAPVVLESTSLPSSFRLAETTPPVSLLMLATSSSMLLEAEIVNVVSAVTPCSRTLITMPVSTVPVPSFMPSPPVTPLPTFSATTTLKAVAFTLSTLSLMFLTTSSIWSVEAIAPRAIPLIWISPASTAAKATRRETSELAPLAPSPIPSEEVRTDPILRPTV